MRMRVVVSIVLLPAEFFAHAAKDSDELQQGVSEDQQAHVIFKLTIINF
jgi:hypothetical protein